MAAVTVVIALLDPAILALPNSYRDAQTPRLAPGRIISKAARTSNEAPGPGNRDRKGPPRQLSRDLTRRIRCDADGDARGATDIHYWSRSVQPGGEIVEVRPGRSTGLFRGYPVVQTWTCSTTSRFSRRPSFEVLF